MRAGKVSHRRYEKIEVVVMSIEDPRVRAFLSEGTRTGKLSYLAKSGQPLVAPAWFVLEDDCLRAVKVIGVFDMTG